MRIWDVAAVDDDRPFEEGIEYGQDKREADGVVFIVDRQGQFG